MKAAPRQQGDAEEGLQFERRHGDQDGKDAFFAGLDDQGPERMA